MANTESTPNVPWRSAARLTGADRRTGSKKSDKVPNGKQKGK